jgi:hypothetical protein
MKPYKCLCCGQEATFQTGQYYCLQHQKHHTASWCRDNCMNLLNGTEGIFNHHKHKANVSCYGEFDCKEVKK